MALPLSGPISVDDIRRELGVPAMAPFSFADAARGAAGYPALNPASAYQPSATPPYALSDWYGYDHSAVANAKEWHWNQNGHAEGWSQAGSIFAWSVQDGVYIMAANGGDPHTYSPSGLNVNGSVFKKVRLRLKYVGDSNWVQVFFITEQSTHWEEAKSKSQHVQFSNQFREITLDFSDLPAWTNGTIRQIRLDPGNTSSTYEHYELDWLIITNQ